MVVDEEEWLWRGGWEVSVFICAPAYIWERARNFVQKSKLPSAQRETYGHVPAIENERLNSRPE